MKKSDMWEQPTVNERLRAQSGSPQAIAATQAAGFTRFGGVRGMERPAIESLLKKSIPVLIIAFLISVAAARGLSLVASHERMEDAVRQATELTSALALAALEDEPQLFQPANADATDDRLEALAPSNTDLLAIDTQGRVMAATGASEHLVGRSLASVVPELVSARPDRGQSGVVETHVEGVPYQVSMHLAGNDGGMVMALHSMQAMNAVWRAEFNLNVTLFAAMALMLLVVVYAYYAQLNRADATADLMSEAKALREAMLSNGEAGLWSFDPHMRTGFLDGSAAAALGLGSQERQLTLRQLLALVHPEDRIGLFRRLSPSDSGLIETTLRVRRRDGQYMRIDLRAHAGLTGETISVSGIATRTSTSYRREVEIAGKRMRLYQAAFDAMPQALALWGKNGRLELANSAFIEAYSMMPGTARDALFDEGAVVIRRTSDQEDITREIRTRCGRWQAVNERLLPDGTSVTVGSDITAFKDDECRLQGEQARLREKVATIAAARRSLELKCAALNRALGRAPSEAGEIKLPASEPHKDVVVRKTVA